MIAPEYPAVTGQTRDYYSQLLALPPDMIDQLCAPRLLISPAQYAGGLAVHTFRHGKAEAEAVTESARVYLRLIAQPIAATMSESDPKESSFVRLLPRPDSLAKNVLPARHKTGRLSSLAIRLLSPVEMPVQNIPYPALARDPLIQNEDGSYWHESRSAYALITGKLSAGVHKKQFVGCGLLLAAGIEDPALSTLPHRNERLRRRVIFKDVLKAVPERDAALLGSWHPEA